MNKDQKTKDRDKTLSSLAQQRMYATDIDPLHYYDVLLKFDRGAAIKFTTLGDHLMLLHSRWLDSKRDNIKDISNERVVNIFDETEHVLSIPYFDIIFIKFGKSYK